MGADDLSHVFGTAAWTMVERMEAGARQQLSELNSLAGSDYEQARELVMYEQSISSAGDELLDPLFEGLRARLDERQARRRRSVNGDPSTQPSGARVLRVTSNGAGRLDSPRRPPTVLYDQDTDRAVSDELESPALVTPLAPPPPPAADSDVRG